MWISCLNGAINNLNLMIGGKNMTYTSELKESCFEPSTDPMRSLFQFFCHQLIHAMSILGKEDELRNHQRRTFFIIIHWAYALTLGQSISRKHWIVHQLHWCEDLRNIEKLKEDFPHMKILGMFRYPMRGIYSFFALDILNHEKAFEILKSQILSIIIPLSGIIVIF